METAAGGHSTQGLCSLKTGKPGERDPKVTDDRWDVQEGQRTGFLRA
jgi:hypothetical protein